MFNIASNNLFIPMVTYGGYIHDFL